MGWCSVMGIFILCVLSTAFYIILPLLPLFYLTRPRVKEQFR
jgi:hypothetical protein